MSVNLQLRKFDVSKIDKNRTLVLIGKRGTGKSFLLRDILWHKKDIPVGAVISPTEKANKFFSDFVPKVFIFDEYHKSIVANLKKRQLRMKKMLENAGDGERNIDPYAYFVMDDCLYDNSWKNDSYIREIFFNFRHFFVFFALTMQFPLGITPQLRSNIDYVFILRENIVSNRRRIYEHYAGMFPTFEMFCSVLDQCTENFECLVIDNHTQSNKIEDQVFWYKAEIHPEFQMGPSEVWEYSERNFADDNDEDDIQIDAYYKSIKKGPKLNVKKI